MKQNITKLQLNSLSPQAREKLHKYLGIKITSTLDWPEKYFEKVLLNIGEMIEFLAKGSQSYYLPGVSLGESEINPETWCDELWEVVKEDLEK